MQIEIEDPLSTADDLPDDALNRVERYLWLGDLSALTNLPLRPHEMMEAAEVLLGAPPGRLPADADHPAPTLSPMLCHRLRVLADEAGPQAGAALLILVADSRARTRNRAHGTFHPRHRPVCYATRSRAV